MSVEKHSPEQLPKLPSRRKPRSPRRVEVGKNGLYQRCDSTEFLQRHIDPELVYLYGKTALRNGCNILIDRQMELPEQGGTSVSIQAVVQRRKSEKIPLTTDVIITERQLLSDEEILVRWPVLESVGVAADMTETLVYSAAHGLEIDDPEELDLNDPRLMQHTANILEGVEDKDLHFGIDIYDSDVVAFMRRTLTVQRNQKPYLRYELGFTYNEDDYYVRDDFVPPTENKLLGDNLGELTLFYTASKEVMHTVEHADGTDFIQALKKLGFRR